jgi:hypothetical protein
MRRFLVYQDSALLIQELVEGADDLRTGISLAKVTSFPESGIPVSQDSPRLR